jgi:hypothetical protein
LILNEIGLELELFLIDKDGNILEPIKYGFPADEMGFLIEIRSEHSNKLEDIERILDSLVKINTDKASLLGFEVQRVPFKEVSKDFQEYIREKYKHYLFPDHTQNIYGKPPVSHHTGFKENLATAGLHVHFSSRRIFGTKCVQRDLPIEKIVKEMDAIFVKDIKDTNRIPGEYEMKSHGFEYRSLPNNIDIKKVISSSLEILEEVK